MAIPYVRATFWRLLPKSGACVLVAYLLRGVIFDARLKKRFDFRHRDGDVVHTSLAAPSFARVESAAHFAQMIDSAEDQRVRCRDRERWPQVALQLVVALPPDDEVSLDEASEIVHEILAQAFHGLSLLAFFVIHEPAVLSPWSRNRHAHVVIALREVLPGGELSGTKLRDLVGRVRTFRPNGGGSFADLVEGISWPDLARDVQSRLFAAFGIDLAVDPISPVPRPRLSEKVWKYDQDQVRAERETIHQRLLAAVQGDPARLVDTMLRGRALVSASEISKVVARVIDCPIQQREALERIFAHPAVICFRSATPAVTHVTTHQTSRLLEEARSYVERSTDGGHSILLARAPDSRTVAKSLASKWSQAVRGLDRTPRCVVIGQFKTHADEFSPPGWTGPVERTTIDELSLETGQPTIVVLPRAEALTDLQLALAINKAGASGARLVLGLDESRADGIGARRLATWIALRLASRRLQSARADDVRAEAARLLKVGLIEPAIRLLSRQGTLCFRGKPRRSTRVDFTVLDDASGVDRVARSLHERSGINRKRTRLTTSRGPLKLAPGELVIFEQTDYRHRPPIVRQGGFATAVEIQPCKRRLRVAVVSGAETDIDLVQFPYLRPAHVLSIREARRAPPQGTMRIEMTGSRHAYACLLLAATYPGTVTLDVSPKVAKKISTLVEVAERSLPAVLPWILKPHCDPRAEKHPSEAESHGQMPEDSSTAATTVDRDFRFELETILLEPLHIDLSKEVDASPVPSLEKPKAPLPRSVPASLRGTISSDPDTLRAFEQLRLALAPNAVDRDETAARIIRIAGEHSHIAVLVHALSPKAPPSRPHAMDEDDLPSDLATLVEDMALSHWEKFSLKIELRMMTLQCSPFGIVPKRPVAIPLPGQMDPDEDFSAGPRF